MALVSLIKTFQGSTSYAADHEGNYTAIEAAINSLGDLTGSALTLVDVPRGLQEIFDRNGIIGEASYKPSDNGGVALPSNVLTIAAGSYWSGTEYRTKTNTTTINMDSYSTGTLYVNVPTGGVPTVTATAEADSVWQFSYNQTTDIVSAVALYSTADILFDGTDYQGMLGAYDSVTDRLAAIEASAGIVGGYYAEDVASHSGLNFGYFAGKVHNDNVVSTTATGTIALTASTTNYVEVTPSTGVVSKNTTSFTAGKIPLFTVVTGVGSISTVTDERTWARAGGGGGGHTQNTDTGTTATEFVLNNDEAGAPSANCALVVERGSSTDVKIRWNEASDKWEYTNDGSTYVDMGAAVLDLGAQELTKYVALADPVQVLERLAISTDGAYVDTDLGPSGINAITDAPQGCAGLVLRVQFWDTTPGVGVNVKFAEYAGASFPLKAYTVWGGTAERDNISTIIVPGDDGAVSPTLGFGHLVTASGANTANVRVFLQGYFVKVTGVGSQTKAFSSTGNVVNAVTTTNFNKTGFVNRGLVYILKVTETGGTMTGTYNISIYAKDTFLAADLLYQATTIDATANSRVYTDRLPFMYLDSDLTSELHIKVQNNDATFNGTFTFALTAEQFL